MDAQVYLHMADEYYSQAEKIKVTIKKYESQLDNNKANLEYLNSKISYYRSLRNEMFITGNKLKNKADKISIPS